MAKKTLSELGLRFKKLAVTAKQYTDDKVGDCEVKLFVKGSANTGFLKTYILAKGADTTLVDGDVPAAQKIGEIDIPKDFLVKSGKMLTVVDQGGTLMVTEENGTAVTPYAAPAAVTAAGQWIDLVVNTKGTTEAEADAHLCFDVTKLVDIYTNGDGLNLNNGVFSVKLNATASGLSVDGNGLTIAIDAINANGLAITASGLKLTPASQSAAGAQSAADKLQQDQIRSDFALLTNGEIISWFGYNPANMAVEGTSEKALADTFNAAGFADSITDE